MARAHGFMSDRQKHRFNPVVAGVVFILLVLGGFLKEVHLLEIYISAMCFLCVFYIVWLGPKINRFVTYRRSKSPK